MRATVRRSAATSFSRSATRSRSSRSNCLRSSVAVRRLAGTVAASMLVAGCGRLNFDALTDAGDAVTHGGDAALDAPPRFGQFSGFGSGRTIAKIEPEQQLVIGASITAPSDFGGGELPYVGNGDA